jgi:4-amino-4-deoxy-L-arabinose transferase-like glycosyltransferase
LSFLRRHFWVLLVFVLALALRAAWSFWADCDPRAVWRFDMSIYDYQALTLARGEGYLHFSGDPTAHWPPGYPLVLAGVYRITGDSLLAGYLLNAVLGSVSVVLVYLVGLKAFGRPAALLGALLLALWPNNVYASSLILTEPLFTALLLLIIVVTAYLLLGQRTPTLRSAAVAGLLLGAASLVRGEALALLLVIGPILLVRWRSWRRTFGVLAVILAGMAVVVGPWTIRNALRMDSFLLISTSGNEALWVGHHEGADGEIADFGPIETPHWGLPNAEKEVKVGDEALRQALEFIKENPLEELRLVPKKLSALYRVDGSGIRWLQLEKPSIPVGAGENLRTLGNVYYWAIIGLVVIGLPTWFSVREPARLLLAGVVLCWSVLFGFVFFGDQRFHVPVTPIFALWAAVALVHGRGMACCLTRTFKSEASDALDPPPRADCTRGSGRRGEP